MSAMGTQLTGARQLFDKCAKKEVEVRLSQGSVVSQSSLHLRMYCVSVQLEGGDLARIRDVSAWQRLLKAKLDEQEELEMSRRSRSRVVTKVFTQADFRQDQETVVKQFHEQVLPVPLPSRAQHSNQRIVDVRQGITQLRGVLSTDQLNSCLEAVEERFNHVINVVNTMSLQHILESVGFTTFKLRHVGRCAGHSSCASVPVLIPSAAQVRHGDP